jgi:hypothetical protein
MSRLIEILAAEKMDLGVWLKRGHTRVDKIT